MWRWLAVAVASSGMALGAVDQSAYDGLLKRHVKDGLVSYTALKDDPALGAYVASLADVELDKQGSDQARQAVLINAYNAFVLKGVVDHWPVRKVAAVPGFFDKQRFKLAGAETTLDELEKRIRQSGDARVHAALTNGAQSGPPLRGEAYLADRLDEQLDQQARRWTSDRARNRIDREARTLYASRIFQWFAADFERAGGPAGFIKQHIASEEDRAWLGAGDYQVKYLDFDWSLNQQ